MSRMVCGKNAVKEILNTNPSSIEKILLQTEINDILSLIKKNNVKFEIVGKNKLNAITSENHQGVVAYATDYKYYNLNDIISKDNKSLIIVLDGLKDPHNLGAILRTCEATNVDGVIIPKNRSVRLNETVSKVSTGAIELVKVVEVVNLSQTLEKLKDYGYWIVGAEHEETSQNYWDMKYDMPTVLVIGSEGEGISRIVKEKCDFLVDIPMNGKINSLNASVSTAIIIYEIRRQQRFL